MPWSIDDMKPYRITALLLLFGLGAGDGLAAAADEALATRINQQLKTAGRGQYDAVKDPGRRPVETARFFGVKADMTVLDVIAGAGYNTEILSAAVGPTGIVYAQNSHFVLQLIDGALHKAMLGRLANHRLPNVRYMVVDAQDMPFVDSIDMAFWGTNMHDIYNADGEAETLQYLDAIKRALKPGGILAISEHVGVAGNDNAGLHRLEPRIVTELLEKAGFVIEATSDLLANPADDHSQSVFADELRYRTDRILVRARKPA
jgi:predicted methyltransferase